MGDSGPCLMHAFSYTSGMPNQAQQGNPMNALGESVSFGRFMSESLSWEKWSTFSQNRYVEEAERYARPGSVAQKKAFFEAHYKRIAAQKAAAALLEQENNNAAKNTTEPESETVLGDNNPTNSETMVLSASQEAVVELVEPEVKKTEQPESDITVKYDCEKISEVKSDEQVAVGEVVEKSHVAVEQEAVPAETLQDMTSGSELSAASSQTEKPLLKGNSSDLQEEVTSVKSKKKSAFASLKSSVYRKTSKFPFSPAKPTASSSHHVKKDNNNPTPLTKNPTKTVDLTEKKRSTPKKSLQKYLTSTTPAKEPDKVITNRKKESSKAAAVTAVTSYKNSQDCATPLRTPNMAPSAKVSQYAPATPCRESSRPKSPNYGSKSTGPKWHILSAVYSKSLTACRSKLQSPSLSTTPFILRTEERAARRKQKLEEKFNSKEVQKVQLQTKIKEKAESELRKLRQSFCFKARPLPDFYKEREPTKIQTKKSSVTPHHHSANPGPGRKPSSSSTISVPSSSSISKNNKSSTKHVSSTRNAQKPQNTPSFFPSVPETVNHENKSPNILY